MNLRPLFLSSLCFTPVTINAALVWSSPLDGNANATVGPDGVANGSPVPTEDRFGNAGGAVLFNGVDSYFNLGVIASSLTAGSMSAWVRTDDHGTERGAIAMGVSGGGNANYFTVQDTANGQWRADVDDGNDGGSVGRRDARSNLPVVAIGTWQHLAVTFATGGNLIVYIDGVAQTDVQALGTQPITPLGDWLIGAERTTERYFSGAMDDVRLYDSELTAAEVSALAAIPEPSTGILGALGFAFCFMSRRRK